jgi:hypothetical protein
LRSGLRRRASPSSIRKEPNGCAGLKWRPSEAELAQYVGTYYSSELDVVYRIVVEDGSLAAQRPRQPALELFPSDRNRFGSSSPGLSTVEFSREEFNRVDGFRASGGRVRNLRFDLRILSPALLRLSAFRV